MGTWITLFPNWREEPLALPQWVWWNLVLDTLPGISCKCNTAGALLHGKKKIVESAEEGAGFVEVESRFQVEQEPGTHWLDEITK